ncbi:MAG: aminotransferase class I/II-fold pyridoxal phosphate-dependent enzyme [Candidatus Dormibacteraeota bacterium]|nr:aminotransferase class I/II-fold pyridoxal phosphate-dependent enzyme [Candidatus Dormibacteraeota bacterium]
MSKLVEATHVTFGSEIGSPDAWAHPCLDDEHMRYASELLNAADALLLGRLTYEGLSVVTGYVEALREMGYELHVPEATFYLLPRSPVPDSRAFAARLEERDVFVLPGTAVEMPAHFRISLTATDDMIDRALPSSLKCGRRY